MMIKKYYCDDCWDKDKTEVERTFECTECDKDLCYDHTFAFSYVSPVMCQECFSEKNGTINYDTRSN